MRLQRSRLCNRTTWGKTSESISCRPWMNSRTSISTVEFCSLILWLARRNEKTSSKETEVPHRSRPDTHVRQRYKVRAFPCRRGTGAYEYSAYCGHSFRRGNRKG